MLHRRVNGYDMAYIEVGQGEPLVCVHGTLCDFRIWSQVLGPLFSQTPRDRAEPPAVFPRALGWHRGRLQHRPAIPAKCHCTGALP